MRRPCRIALAAFLVLLAAGCSKAGFVRTDIYEDGFEYLRSVYEQDGEEAVVPRGYEHPQNWTEAEVRTLLESFRFQEYAFFHWGRLKPVFVESEVDRLAPALAEAFTRLGPDEWIEFSSTARKRDYLLPTLRITDGWLYVEEGRINLVLDNLNFEAIDADERQRGDPRRFTAIQSYRLVADDAHHAPPVVDGDRFLRREHANWLQVDLASFLAGAAPPPEPEPPAMTDGEAPPDWAVEPAAAPRGETPDERTVRQRLEELNSLLDAGLVTQEEYERLRQEILEDL